MVNTMTIRVWSAVLKVNKSQSTARSPKHAGYEIVIHFAVCEYNVTLPCYQIQVGQIQSKLTL